MSFHASLFNLGSTILHVSNRIVPVYLFAWNSRLDVECSSLVRILYENPLHFMSCFYLSVKSKFMPLTWLSNLLPYHA